MYEISYFYGPDDEVITTSDLELSIKLKWLTGTALRDIQSEIQVPYYLVKNTIKKYKEDLAYELTHSDQSVI